MALRPFLPLLPLLAASLLITRAQGIGSSALDCCLKNSPLQKEIPSGVVTSYRLQGPDSGCFLRSVVLITRKNKKICASPDDNAIQKLMQQLNKRAKNVKNRNKGQTQRPRGRPKKQRRQRV